MTNLREPRLLDIETFADERGQVRHYGGFQLPNIKRVYFVEPGEPGEFRGWHGHKYESKVFRCIKGSFTVNLILVEDWEAPSGLHFHSFELSESEGNLVIAPPGFANAITSRESGSIMMVMSDRTLEQSQDDDYRYEQGSFSTKNGDQRT